MASLTLKLRNILGGILNPATEEKQLPDNHNVTVSNLPGTQPVSATALPLPNGAAAENTQLRRLGGGKIPVATTVTAPGDNDVYVPAAGKRVRVYWVYAINDPVASSAPVIKVKLGVTEIYRVWAVAHWEVFEGAPDERLKVNLSAAGNVLFTAHVEEF